MVMGKPKLQINRNAWYDYYEKSEKMFGELKHDAETALFDLAVKTYNEYRKEWETAVGTNPAEFDSTDRRYSWNKCPFMTQLDWKYVFLVVFLGGHKTSKTLHS